MSRYATGTTVSVEQSLSELRGHIRRFGGEGFAYMEAPGATRVYVGFQIKGQTYRLDIPMPEPKSFPYPDQREKELRRRWRVLTAFTKAVLFGVDEGVIKLQDALLPFAMLPSGHTVAEDIQPQMQAAVKDGRMPRLALSLPSSPTAETVEGSSR